MEEMAEAARHAAKQETAARLCGGARDGADAVQKRGRWRGDVVPAEREMAARRAAE